MEDAEKERLRPLGLDAERQRPLASREIEAILDNTDFMILLSQAQSDRAILAKQLGISGAPALLHHPQQFRRGPAVLWDVTIPFVDRFPVEKSITC